MTDLHFEALAAKALLGEAMPNETAELEALLASEPALREEFAQLKVAHDMMREFGPLLRALNAPPRPVPPERLRRLQAAVSQAPQLGRTALLGEQLDLPALKEFDTAAWDQAFKLLWPVALGEVRRRGLGDQDAEEVAQQSLRQLVTALEKVSTPEHLVRLLLHIARRRAADWAKRHWADKRGANLTDSLQAVELTTGQPWDPPADSPSPRDVAMRQECLRSLAEALQCLGEPDRGLLEGRYFDGKTYDQLSREYGLPLGTVASKISRALARIRAALKKSQRLWEELRGGSR